MLIQTQDYYSCWRCSVFQIIFRGFKRQKHAVIALGNVSFSKEPCHKISGKGILVVLSIEEVFPRYFFVGFTVGST